MKVDTVEMQVLIGAVDGLAPEPKIKLVSERLRGRF